LGIEHDIISYREEINIGLKNIYPVGPKSLKDPIDYVLNASGKRIRPLLAILTAKACGGSKQDVFSEALALELLHNFTLIHDDIMDEDLVRRGRKTVHNKWDEGIALLAGDAMLSLALKMINKSNQPLKQMPIFINGLLAVCEGQALDKEFEKDNYISLKNYLNMIDLKTGYMIGLSCHMGALATGMNNSIALKLRDYGRLLGRAFQIQDDYLEIFSDSVVMGKSLQSDILLGKKTFIIIKAMEKDLEKINNGIKIAKIDFTKGIKYIRNFIISSGIKDMVINEIDNIIKSADSKLENINIKRENLLYFSNLIKDRKK
tara:strand:+ start:167 stop:1120 length:954 start_codon:yes stop_codon:yes gene_type:complete